MCIGNFCAYLTPAEQRTQHDFEERKGPYPLALALRLEAEGVMTRKEHLERSAAIINGRAVQWFKYGDRMQVETDFIEGRLHLIPHDPYLTPENQAKIHQEARFMRRAFFCRKVKREEAPIVFLATYPECGEWLSELIATRTIGTSVVARKLVVQPTLLSILAPTMGDKSLFRLVFDLAVLCGRNHDTQTSDDPALRSLWFFAKEIAETNTTRRLDVKQEMDAVVHLQANATGKFRCIRSQERRHRLRIRKEFERRINRLRSAFFKRNDYLAIMARVVRDLKFPTADLQRAA